MAAPMTARLRRLLQRATKEAADSKRLGARGISWRDTIPARFLLLRWLDRRFNVCAYPTKLRFDLAGRPHYGHSLYHAAILARKLGHGAVTAIEFGVAGGNGLLALEAHAAFVTRETGVNVNIYGFDTGAGMPPPKDYRDIPYLWQEGYFKMDWDALRSKLQNSTVILGPVEETVPRFCQENNPPPIGFIAFDLDYYSSTVAAFKIFDAMNEFLLPRIVCYFDDMVGDVDWAYNEFTGELLAINEFNALHPDIKIAPVRGLRYYGQQIPQSWHEQIFVAHLFRHPDYGHPISDLQQLPLVNPQ